MARPNEATGFEPYYAIEYAEGTYGSNSGYTRVDFFPTMDDWETVYSVPDEDWDDMEFARRVFMHVTGGGEPTKKIQRRFLAGPAAGWEPGMRWSADQGYRAAWAHEHGI